jgi:Sodium/hydrogen exchanger family
VNTPRTENRDPRVVSNAVAQLGLRARLLTKTEKHGLELAHNTTSSTALPYHEPEIGDILILSSFLLILNLINSVIDRYVYCGLVGQILIGIAWGAPASAWLSTAAQETITQLGYLGLLLLVFEGGLSISFIDLKKNLLLSLAVAVTGILFPMALSFSLLGIADATALQAFAAGAALCSTSLGTTLTLLSSTGLARSRLGIVLSSAAMLDDIVGLVMVQIILNLGTVSSLSAMTVIRPILVSLAFAALLPVIDIFFIKPATHSTFFNQQGCITTWTKRVATGSQLTFVIHTLLLIAFITGASYAGTSNLFSAYLAGAIIGCWDAEKDATFQAGERDLTAPIPLALSTLNGIDSRSQRLDPAPSSPKSQQTVENMTMGQNQKNRHFTGSEIYAEFFGVPVRRVLNPFFFVSLSVSMCSILAILTNSRLRSVSPFLFRGCSLAISFGVDSSIQC